MKRGPKTVVQVAAEERTELEKLGRSQFREEAERAAARQSR